MHKSGICDTEPAISLKQSSLEPNVLQSVYSVGQKTGPP